MTEQEFKTRFAHVNDQADAKKVGADSYRDQGVAQLLIETEDWTPAKIMELTGNGKGWVSQQRLFSRFLHSFTGCEHYADLTEGRFRKLWKESQYKVQVSRNKDNEERRFAEVLKMIEEGGGVPAKRDAVERKGLREAIATLADGKWYYMHQIHAKVEQILAPRLITEGNVRANLHTFHARPLTGFTLVHKKIGDRTQYCFKAIPKSERPISPAVAVKLFEGAKPLIRQLKQLGRMHELQSCPQQVLQVAIRLEKLFAEVFAQIEEAEESEIAVS